MRKVEAKEILGNVKSMDNLGKRFLDVVFWWYKGKFSHKRESKLRTAKWQADEQKGT